jgi:hypothetical protein
LQEIMFPLRQFKDSIQSEPWHHQNKSFSHCHAVSSRAAISFSAVAPRKGPS